MAAGLQGWAVASQEPRSAEKQDPLLPWTHVDFFQNLSVGIYPPGMLLARPQEAFFTVLQSPPAPRLAFTNDVGNIGAWVPGFLCLRVPHNRLRKTVRFARRVILLQLIIDIDCFEFDQRVMRVLPCLLELFDC